MVNPELLARLPMERRAPTRRRFQTLLVEWFDEASLQTPYSAKMSRGDSPMRAVAFLGLLLVPASLPAQKVDRCEFTVVCTLPNEQVELSFASKTRDCSEDDTEVWLGTGADRKKLDLPEAWYVDIDNVGNRISPCRSSTYPEYPAFPLPDRRVLIFLRQLRRPGVDNLSVAVVDLATSRVVDRADLGHSLRFSTGVVETGSRFQIPLIREGLAGVRCDCDAAFIEGWLEITVGHDGKLKKRWRADGRPEVAVAPAAKPR